MALLAGIRKLFRREPVIIDIQRDAQDHSESNGEVVAVSDSAGKPLQRRSTHRAIADLQRGYDEVLGLVRKIGDHLDAQAERTTRLTQLLERLPEAIDALPELNRHNTRLIEVLSEHLEHARFRDESLDGTLSKLSKSSTQQTEVLGLVQQQLDSYHHTSSQMAEALGSFRQALSDLAATNSRSAKILATMAQTSQDRETTLGAALSRVQRWLIAAVACIGAAAVAALVLAVWTLTQRG